MVRYQKIANLYSELAKLGEESIIKLFHEVYYLEKIDGSSAHVKFTNPSPNEDPEKVELEFFGGGQKQEMFEALFDKERLRKVFVESFGADIETVTKDLMHERVYEKNRGDMPTKAEIQKILVKIQRLEDKRDRESIKRHDELLERVDTMMRQNAAFGRRQRDRSEFASLMRDGGLSRQNGTVSPVPTSKGVLQGTPP